MDLYCPELFDGLYQQSSSMPSWVMSLVLNSSTGILFYHFSVVRISNLALDTSLLLFPLSS